MQREDLIERFFNALISGDRPAAREVVDELLQADCPANTIMTRLFWPTLEHIQKLHRADQMSELSHHYATRLLRMLTDQMQLRLESKARRGKSALVMCGPEEPEELAAQMVADLLEADGYDVYFLGGGVANDEVVAQLAELNADRLVVFGATPGTVPHTRLLIDHLHEIGAAPDIQIIVGGGVFNRADGLAEEIGADLWANDPDEVLQVMEEEPQRRMSPDQRTVGRKRRPKAKRAVAAA
jgi:methanogenic corrinoid protein MtbC1